MSHELHKKHRPTRFKDIIGQTEAVNTLQGFIKKGKVPHAILITGHSGCGKTTLARILRDKLGCHQSDYFEMNCADVGGIDNIRRIASRMTLSSLGGSCRIYYIDEAHGLTAAAQDALLKLLEDPPKHVYFILTTTDPGKLKTTIKTRCTTVNVQPLGQKDMKLVVQRVIKKEQLTISEEVVERLIQAADGSARKALVLLDQIYLLEDEEQQLDAIVKSDSQQQAIQICRALLNPRTDWRTMSEILKNVNEEPESIRRMILGYMSAVVLGGKQMASRAAFIIEVFRDHFYDCGKAGLVAGCYQIITGK